MNFANRYVNTVIVYYAMYLHEVVDVDDGRCLVPAVDVL